MDNKFLAGLKFTAKQIAAKRAEVRGFLISRSSWITGGNLTRMATSDLKLLFVSYDNHFFSGYFQNSYRGKLDFSLSTRMTRNAGKISYPKNLHTLSPEEENYELKISTTLFFLYDKLDREKIVNGIETRDALDALQLVYEHELCHLIELHCFQESSCRGERFKSMARNIFGHAESYHRLVTVPEIADSKYGLRVGDPVRFAVEGTGYNGFISRINKRATVMVEDKNGDFTDRKGRRYRKWYVPIPMLERR